METNRVIILFLLKVKNLNLTQKSQTITLEITNKDNNHLNDLLIGTSSPSKMSSSHKQKRKGI